MEGWQWKPAFRRGLAHATAGAWEKAVAEFTQALEFTPDDPRPWLERTRAYWKLNVREKAAADLRKALKIPTADTRCLRVRGELCLLLGQWAEAVAEYSR